MTSLSRKSTLPAYHPSRSNPRRACRIVVEPEEGTPLSLGCFEKSPSLLAVSDNTRSAVDAGDIVNQFRVDYPFLIVQTVSGLCVINLRTNDRAFFALPQIHWFISTRNILYVYHGAKLRKISIDVFPEVTFKDFEFDSRCETLPLRDARVLRDDASNSILVISRASLQLWDYKNSSSPKGNLLLEYTAPNPFGIMLAKSYGNTVAAVVDSGETLVVLHSSNDRISIESDHTISALHMDERYVIVGHTDGSITAFDRLSSLQLAFPPAIATPGPSEGWSIHMNSILNTKCMVVWIGRFGDFVFTACQFGLGVYYLGEGNAGLVTTVQFPKDTKMETAQLDAFGTFYATLIDSEKNAIMFTWRGVSGDTKSTPKVTRAPDVSKLQVPLTLSWTSLMERNWASWTRMEVCAFLEHLNLEEYKILLFKNKISGLELKKMTEENLLSMGVVTLGHRKRLWTALQRVKEGLEVSCYPSELPPSPTGSIFNISVSGSDDATNEDSRSRTRTNTMDYSSDLSTSSSASAPTTPPRSRSIPIMKRNTRRASNDDIARECASPPSPARSAKSGPNSPGPERGFIIMLAMGGEATPCRFSSSRIQLTDVLYRITKQYGEEIEPKIMINDEHLQCLTEQETLTAAIRDAKREGKRKLKLYLFDASAGKSPLSREREKLMGSPEVVVLLDEHACIQMLNVPAERFFGYTAGELIHKHVQKLFPNAPYAHSINHLGGLTTEQHSIALVMKKDGSLIGANMVLKPLQTNDLGAHAKHYVARFSVIEN